MERISKMVSEKESFLLREKSERGDLTKCRVSCAILSIISRRVFLTVSGNEVI